MNNKTLVEVLVPASRQSYDIWLPNDLLVADLSDLLGSVLSELSGGLYVFDEDTVLCNRGSGLILSADMTINELELRNGSRLMIV